MAGRNEHVSSHDGDEILGRKRLFQQVGAAAATRRIYRDIETRYANDGDLFQTGQRADDLGGEEAIHVGKLAVRPVRPFVVAVAFQYRIYYIRLMLISRAPIRSELRLLLRQQITYGDLAPSQTLNPAQLATAFDVSQTPVREAMIELVRDGFIDASPNRGFMIRPLTTPEAREIYPLMWDLETTAIYASALPADRLDRLVAINEDLTRATDSAEQLRLDGDWHEELVRGCGNQTLIDILDVLRWRIRRYEAAYIKQERLSAQSAVQHHALVLALRRNDLERAAQIVELKWRASMDLMVVWLGVMADARVPRPG